ncbi:MAG: toprim domain-containing protein [Candidatus Aenigmarchaeota archaeon]|nr:toprim domain-containing protein [Candidatus Aenigmarchaeota archaeon]
MNRNPDRIIEFFGEIGDCLLIVEGKKDAKALNTLGLTNILAINGKPLIAIAEKLNQVLKAPAGTMVAESGGSKEHSDIIILTDFDREGRRIASTLSRLLRAHKMHPNQRLRSCIMKFGFSKIEEFKMETIMKMKERTRKESPSGGRFKKRGDVYVKTSSNVNKIRCKGNYKSERCSGKAGYHRSGVRPD